MFQSARLLVKQRRAGVPQVMEADAPHAGSITELGEVPIDVAWLDRRAQLGGEDQATVGPRLAGRSSLLRLLCPVLFEGDPARVRHRNRPLGSVGLHRPVLKLPSSPIEGLADADDTALQIDI
jgi:hypothetical protein